MIKTLRVLLTITWSLWFGGMIALLIFVVQLFKTSHETGVIGAPVLFRAFATYQIILASAALALSIISRLRVATLFIAIAFGMALTIRTWTNEIESLRATGQSQSERFKTLHGRSSIAYSASAISLLIAGIAISITPRNREKLPVASA